VHKTHFNADDHDADATAASAPATATDIPWWEWVQQHCDYRMDMMREAVAHVIGQTRREVDGLKRELTLLQREFGVLRDEAKVERGLHDLRDEIAQARAQVPNVPAIAAQLEADQRALQRELDETKARLRATRVDVSVAGHRIAELDKETKAAKAAAKAASIDVELERLAHIS
jgi:chromosome segregation ATPase